MNQEYQWAWIIGRCNQCCKCYGQFPVAEKNAREWRKVSLWWENRI